MKIMINLVIGFFFENPQPSSSIYLYLSVALYLKDSHYIHIWLYFHQILSYKGSFFYDLINQLIEFRIDNYDVNFLFSQYLFTKEEIICYVMILHITKNIFK